MKRFRQRIDHGDVIESPSGEFYLVSEVDARIAELETLLHRCIEHRQADEVAHQERVATLYDALQGVMEWIDNWDPQFIHDDDWPETHKAIVDLLNTRTVL